MTSTERGHRVVPHTADVRLEAWAPTVAACLEEAAAGLLGVCFDPGGAEPVDTTTISVPGGPLDAMLLDLLDELIFVLDTVSLVPIAASAREDRDGGVAVELDLAPRSAVEAVGAVPKGISRSEVQAERQPEGVHCSFLVDV